MDLYVYYRAPIDLAARVETAVADLQASLRAGGRAPALRCGLKRRPQAVDGRQTWMEVYLRAPDDFEAVLAQALERNPLPTLIDGVRHVEIFVESLPCA